MKIKRTSLILAVFLFLFYSGNVFGQKLKDVSDPFEPLLPKADESTGSDSNVAGEEQKELTVSVEGVLWGTDMPMAIIDGEVYREGDVIVSNGAKIYKIENNEVLIYYDGRLHNRKVGQRFEKGD